MRTMDQTALQALFNRFAAPLAAHATSATRRESAEILVKTLWMALIAGRDAENETWATMRTIGGLDDERLKPIQDCYYQRMKPQITDEELAGLRAKFGNRPATS